MKQQDLTEALAFADAPGFSLTHPDFWIHGPSYIAAARLVERLLPGECDRALGKNCPFCFNTGRVWDEAIVEAVAKAMNPWLVGSNISRFGQEAMARAVLSAIAQLAEAGSQ